MTKRMSRSGQDETIAALLDPLEDVPVVALDAEGRIVRWTEGAARLTGFEASEMLERHVAELYSEDDVERGLPAADLRRAVEDGQLVRDRWLRRSDGTRLWARTIVRPRHDDQGRLTGFVTLTVDLTDQLEIQRDLSKVATERAASERELRDRELRARRLADAMPFPIQLIDLQLRYVFANVATADWLGVGREQIPGLTVVEVAGRLDSGSTLQDALPCLTEALEGRACTYTGRAKRADGAIREVDIRFVPARYADGRVDGVYAVLLDRTDERRSLGARRFLADAAALLAEPHGPELILESTVALATMGFADRCVLFQKLDAKRVRSYTASRERSTVQRSDLPLSELPRRVLDVMGEGGTRAYVDLSDRSSHVVSAVSCTEAAACAVSFAWRDPFEIGAEHVEAADDLTKRLEQAIDRLQLFERTIEATQARDWLLEKVTHDLGNPIASISMAAEHMQRTSPTPDRRVGGRPLLDGIARQAREMELILDELLDVAALKTGHVTVEPRPVSAKAIVDEAVALAEIVTAARGVELSVHTPAEAPVVLADPYHVRRALSALIYDAVERADAGDAVRVNVERNGTEVRFAVTRPQSTVPTPSDRPGDPPGGTVRASARATSLSLLVADSIVRSHGSRLRRTSEGGSISHAFVVSASP